ncbi:MAG: N-acetyltransferase family protein [Bacillota bacterium]
MAAQLQIGPVTEADWPEMRSIYLEGIRTGNATFETDVPDWRQWQEHHLPCCALAVRGGGEVLGWAALSPVSPREVYAGVAEVSVYVRRDVQRQGIGTDLMRALIACSEDEGIWTLQAGVFPENRTSLSLLARCGFRRVGRRERLGQLHGKWRDVILVERRSPRVGM